MPSRKAPVISAPTLQQRQAPFKPLDLPSLDFSLTAGTDIPSPPATPDREEIDRSTDGEPIVRSPTPGGGPLSSHPTTPVVAMPGAFPLTPTSTELKANRVLGRIPGDKADSAYASHSHLPFPREASAAALPRPTAAEASSSSRRSSITGGRKGGSSMRRLFSLRSLYSNSNGSSTDCFSAGGANGYTGSSLHLHYDPTQPHRLARATSTDSLGPTPFRPASSMASPRPDSRMTNATAGSSAGGMSPGAQQKRRTSAFFGSAGSRRKSGLFLFGGARVDEHGMIPEHSVVAAVEADKENLEPPPKIKEVEVDTSIGGEELFRDIK